MSRKTIEAENDFRTAANELRRNVGSSPTTTNFDLQIITNNQFAIADALADAVDGLQKLAVAIRDVYDVCARIEARQKGGTGTTTGTGGGRIPSTP
jgi:hypothetical protein